MRFTLTSVEELAYEQSLTAAEALRARAEEVEAEAKRLRDTASRMLSRAFKAIGEAHGCAIGDDSTIERTEAGYVIEVPDVPAAQPAASEPPAAPPVKVVEGGKAKRRRAVGGRAPRRPRLD